MHIAKVFRFNEQSITTIKENEEQLLTQAWPFEFQ